MLLQELSLIVISHPLSCVSYHCYTTIIPETIHKIAFSCCFRWTMVLESNHNQQTDFLPAQAAWTPIIGSLKLDWRSWWNRHDRFRFLLDSFGYGNPWSLQPLVAIWSFFKLARRSFISQQNHLFGTTDIVWLPLPFDAEKKELHMTLFQLPRRHHADTTSTLAAAVFAAASWVWWSLKLAGCLSAARLCTFFLRPWWS